MTTNQIKAPIKAPTKKWALPAWLVRWFHPRRLLIGIAIAMGATVVVAHAALVWTEVFNRWLGPFLSLGPPTVSVAQSEQKSVPLNITLVGNTVAPRKVDVRARVEGWLAERLFTEGDDVAEGQLLYVIDERPFQAKLDQAKAQLAKDEAALSFAKEQVVRYGKLVEKEYVTRELYDQYVTQAGEAEGMVAADRAAVEQAALDLSYCRIYALVSGRIGRTSVDVGNLVGQTGTDTTLTTIVPLDPIYVTFSPNDNQLLRISEARNKGEVPVTLTFQNGSPYDPAGRLEFIDNALNPQTSTVAMRGIFPNPEKLLLPGIFVNVHVKVGEEDDAVLIPETALSETQAGFIVYIVGKDRRVEQRVVEKGEPFGTLRVITKGIAAGETVIVEGMHKVKPGMKVKPEASPSSPASS